MSSYTFFLACILLIQNAYSQCIGSLGSSAYINQGYGANIGLGNQAFSNAAFEGLRAPFAGYGPAALEAGAYGGEGIGDVAVAGEMPVAGTTLVAGQVPILGAVRFAGDLPAGGVVSIAGSTGCGCSGPIIY